MIADGGACRNRSSNSRRAQRRERVTARGAPIGYARAGLVAMRLFRGSPRARGAAFFVRPHGFHAALARPAGRLSAGRRRRSAQTRPLAVARYRRGCGLQLGYPLGDGLHLERGISGCYTAGSGYRGRGEDWPGSRVLIPARSTGTEFSSLGELVSRSCGQANAFRPFQRSIDTGRRQLVDRHGRLAS